MMIEKDNDDGVAIDFLALMREEKRRARQQRKKKDSATVISEDNVAITSVEPQLPPWSHPPLECCLDLQLDLDQYRVSTPDTCYYIPQFLPPTHQENLLEWLQSLPEASTSRTTTSEKTKQQLAGCWNTMKYGKRRVALFDKDLPPPLQQLVHHHLSSCFPKEFPPNHVLVNEYQPGQGILPHTDGPAYAPRTATLSIGASPVLLQFSKRLATQDIGTSSEEQQHDDGCYHELLLDGHGSLVVFTDDLYTNYTHAIEQHDAMREVASEHCVNASAGTVVERGYRISLTFRHYLGEEGTTSL